MIDRFASAETLLRNRSSFLYGRKPAGSVPIYAAIKNCVDQDSSTDAINPIAAREEKKLQRKGSDVSTYLRDAPPVDDFGTSMILANDLPGKVWKSDAILGAEVITP